MTPEALFVTPADIAWYLAIFPDGKDRIKELETHGKIVVAEGSTCPKSS